MVFMRCLLFTCAIYIFGVRCLPLNVVNEEIESIPTIKLVQYMSFKERLKFAIPSLQEQLEILYGKPDAFLKPNLKHMNPAKVGFYMYSRKNPSEPIRIFVNDTDGLKKSGYEIKYKTKLLVHGFLNSLTSDMIQQIKDNLFSATDEDLNVIAVDWSAYTLFYVNVYEKSMEVGGIIAEFINYLAREGTALDDIHCIGHSLGAHACGFAGSGVQGGLIGRISGLDPAQPGFDVGKIYARLNITDAQFVDCIHTCGGFLGITEPICSADFYPNTGAFQPGCPWYDAGACSHGRAHEFYAESILPGHVFPSLSCETLQFRSRDCSYKGGVMGYPASKKYIGILYTTTRDSSPYALNYTAVDIK